MGKHAVRRSPTRMGLFTLPVLTAACLGTAIVATTPVLAAEIEPTPAAEQGTTWTEAQDIFQFPILGSVFCRWSLCLLPLGSAGSVGSLALGSLLTHVPPDEPPAEPPAPPATPPEVPPAPATPGQPSPVVAPTPTTRYPVQAQTGFADDAAEPASAPGIPAWTPLVGLAVLVGAGTIRREVRLGRS